MPGGFGNLYYKIDKLLRTNVIKRDIPRRGSGTVKENKGKEEEEAARLVEICPPTLLAIKRYSQGR